MIRFYGDPGFNLSVLPEIAELIGGNLTPIPHNAPIIGEVFSTQAGIHQAGVARQEDAPGGLIYLAYDPSIVGRDHVEKSMVGAMSGSEGIVAILNQEAERRGVEMRFSSMSRVVKEIYDKVQAAYDGEYDQSTNRWEGYRTTFFTAEEIWQMASESIGIEGGR
jgi:isopropylmalate/homocitrate/citramalate synthase